MFNQKLSSHNIRRHDGWHGYLGFASSNNTKHVDVTPFASGTSHRRRSRLRTPQLRHDPCHLLRFCISPDHSSAASGHGRLGSSIVLEPSMSGLSHQVCTRLPTMYLLTLCLARVVVPEIVSCTTVASHALQSVIATSCTKNHMHVAWGSFTIAATKLDLNTIPQFDRAHADFTFLQMCFCAVLARCIFASVRLSTSCPVSS